MVADNIGYTAAIMYPARIKARIVDVAPNPASESESLY
jgi:hypothetical protein